MSSRKANFEIVEDKADCLCIRDCGPWDKHPTVTNDAEDVVAVLAPRLNGRRLEYFDSNGDRDQLLVADGKFAGFALTPRQSQNGTCQGCYTNPCVCKPDDYPCDPE